MKDRIPRALWDRVLKFMDGNPTGQVVLHLHHGKVRSVSFSENYRHEDPVVPIETPALPALKTR